MIARVLGNVVGEEEKFEETVVRRYRWPGRLPDSWDFPNNTQC